MTSGTHRSKWRGPEGMVRNCLRRLPFPGHLLLAPIAAILVLGGPCRDNLYYYGVDEVGTRDGDLVAGVAHTFDRGSQNLEYESRDGGFTWSHYTPDPNTQDPRGPVQWSEGEVTTNLGRYSVEGADVVFTPTNGQPKVVYSSAYLQDPANKLIRQRREHEEVGRAGLGNAPKGSSVLAGDPVTGNIVVALGLQGVVVGTPDGRWHSIAVGPYAPDDFSNSGRFKALLKNIGFWTALLSFPLAVTALAIASTRMSSRSSSDLHDFLFVMCAFATLAAMGLLFTVDSDQRVENLAWKVSLTLLIVSTAPPVTMGLLGKEWTSLWISTLGKWCAMFLVVFFAFAAWAFIGGSTLYAELSALVICGLIAISLAVGIRRDRAKSRQL